MRSWITSTLLALAATGSSTLHAQQVLPTFDNLVYGNVGTQQQPRLLSLDLYIPDGKPGPHPVVLRIHGGGWSGGSNQPIPGQYVTLLDQGFAIASVQYRLTSQAAMWSPAPVTFPAQINDVKGAVRWLRANASTYNLDPARFGSCGESAGGHLSALLGTTGNNRFFFRNGVLVDLEGNVGGNLQWSSRTYATADYFGPTDLLSMNADVTTPPGSNIDHDAPNSPESNLIGWTGTGQGIGDIRDNISNPTVPYPNLSARTIAANPVTHVDPASPPFLILHGAMDTAVPANQSVRLRDALLGAGVPVQHLINPTGGHATWPDGNTAVVAFFNDRLVANPPAICPGDADGSGVVDFADVTMTLANFGRPGGVGEPGDADANGTVNFTDITTILGNWGGGCD